MNHTHSASVTRLLSRRWSWVCAAALLAVLPFTGACGSRVKISAAERRAAQQSLDELAHSITATLESENVSAGELRGNVATQLEDVDAENVDEQSLRYVGRITFDVTLTPLENEHFYEHWMVECVYREGEWRLRRVTSTPTATDDADEETRQIVGQLEPRVKELGDMPASEFQLQ